MTYTKGDILLPSNKVVKNDWLNGLFHPAVVWDDNYDGNTDFRGIMLTHSTPSKGFANVLMTANHFEKGYNLGFSNTHFVNQVFIKFHDWGPFERVGKLTLDGVEFIETHLQPGSHPIEFLLYRTAIIV